jgi:hypothetical protein
MERDIFVGSVAICLGIYFIVVALTNAQYHFRLYSSQLLVRALGEQKARIVLVLFGGAVVLLGLFIITKRQSIQSNRLLPNYNSRAAIL